MTEQPCPCGSRDHARPDPAPPRIWFLRFTTPDGIERRRYVACPYYIKDPQASIYGLENRLGYLKFHRLILRGSANEVEAPRHKAACVRAREQHVAGHRCDCFPRWTEIPELMEAA
jgi:hypothetical protein